MTEYVRRFRRQFQRFGFALTGCIADVWRFERRLPVYAVISAALGTGLQGLALAGVLVVTRSYETSLREGDVGSVAVAGLPAIPGYAAFLGIVALLTLSALALYEAERAIYTLSIRHGDKSASSLLREYPLLVTGDETLRVDRETGVPEGLASRMRERCTFISRAGRTLFGGGMALLQCLYGIGFLLYLAPGLSLLLGAVTFPLLAPLRHVTRQVNLAEKNRRQMPRRSQEDAAALVEATKQWPLSTDSTLSRRLWERFAVTGMARSNQYILARFVGIARSKALANILLTLTIALSIGYFFGYQGASQVSIASVVVYFAALRVAASSGKELSSRATRFARFYEPVRRTMLERRYVEARYLPDSVTLALSAPELDDTGRRRLQLALGEPVALVGAFPLVPVNTYLLAVFQDADHRLDRGDIVAGMAYIPPDPEIPHDMRWRDWLTARPRAGYQDLPNAAGDVWPIDGVTSPDAAGQQPLGSGSGLGQGARIDLALLRAWLANARLIVVPKAAIEALGKARWAAWTRLLSDRLILTYYQLPDETPGIGGETDAVLIDLQSRVVGLSHPQWLTAHQEQALRLVLASDTETHSAVRRGDDDEDDED